MRLTEQEQKLRSELIERLQSVEDPDILDQVREILRQSDERRDFWEDLTEQQQAMAQKGRAELKAGKGIPAEQVLRGLKK